MAFDAALLKKLRADFPESAFKRIGDEIVCFSPENKWPISGKEIIVDFSKMKGLSSFLFRDSVIRLLDKIGRTPVGLAPIEIISSRADENLIKDIVGVDFPFSLQPRYFLNVRTADGVECLIPDCSARRVCTKNCAELIAEGISLEDKYITSQAKVGEPRIYGQVTGVSGNIIEYLDRDEVKQKIEAERVTIEASNENFDEALRRKFGEKAPLKAEAVRLAASAFNMGPSKHEKIDKLVSFLRKQKIAAINGVEFTIGDWGNVTSSVAKMLSPSLIFNDGREGNWADKNITDYGPYTKSTFDRNNPSVCVICEEGEKGQVETFIRKLLKGIPRHANYNGGFEQKFDVGTARVEFFTTNSNNPSAYKAAVDKAIASKSSDGGKWDLALVQVKKAQKTLPVNESPYYAAKAAFYLHQVPVHSFTLELTLQQDYNLGYSLNNLALATYAKMGGIPWLLKSSPTISHELVIGIGSAQSGEAKYGPKQRLMGITTVFSGDGSYIVSNTSKAVSPDKYQDALIDVLRDTLDKVKRRRNWQKGDTIRIVFHASVKKFNSSEIDAVKAVMEDYRDYKIEYAFLKISEDHGLHLFDDATKGDKKGKLAPARGTHLKISDTDMLVYLIGGKHLRRDTDGHPRGLLVSLHHDSTFKDIKYLATQVFNFSGHSWRSYFPNPMPVTISYSDLLAQNLGWLEQVPGWNPSTMVGKIGQTPWFL